MENKDRVSLSVLACKDEAEEAKKTRMDLNAKNFDAYHLRQDFSHKREGQSKEFLPKQAMAVEQLTSFIQQGLVDAQEWFNIENEFGVPADSPITSDMMKKILKRQVDKNKAPVIMADCVKVGLLGSLMILKVHGEKINKKSYSVSRDEEGKKELRKQTKKVWQLKWDLVRQEDYFPDPTGKKLYEIERITIDLFELIKIAENSPEEYDMEAVKKLKDTEDWIDKNKKSSETNQDVSSANGRNMVVIYEFWGTLLDNSTGEVLHENCTCAVTNSGIVIKKPTKNKLWHEESPYVTAPIIRVPFSVWHKALMDAPTTLNLTINEIFNLMLDSGIMSVFGIKQIKTHLLDNPDQISEGIAPGDILEANSTCGPGEKVLERVDTGALSQESLTMYNLLEREEQASALTNDTRLGSSPQRDVKATQIIASNQSITGIFNGVTKVIETEFINPVLVKSWLTTAQNISEMDRDELSACIGEKAALGLMSMGSEEIFAATALGRRFKVFGLSAVLKKMNDFQKITAFLQTIAGSPYLMQVFLQKYSGEKLLSEILKALDIDIDKIKMDESEQQTNAAMIQNLQQEQQGGPPDNQSQMEQVSGMQPESGTGLEPDRAALSNFTR